MTTQIRPDELIRILKPEFLSIGSGGGVHAGPGIDVVGGVTVGISRNTILLYDAALVVAAEFAATNAGFAAAIAAAAAGDCIQLPMTLTLTAAHTINGDIILRGPCTITANGDYANLLTLDGGATADNIEVSYTTTTAAGGAAIYSSTGCYLRHVNAIVAGDVAGPTYGAHLIDIDPNSRINDCYFEATGDFGGIARYGLRLTSPGGGTQNRLIVENCIGYAHNNTSLAACYGIYIAGSASVAGEVKFTILDGCIGYGYAQWNNGVGWGIYAEDCLLDSCIGYGNGGDTIGIHIVNAYAFSCSGHATHEATGVQEAIGILVGGNGEAYSCRAVVTTTAGTEYGFYCDGADPVVCGGYGHGDTADVYVDAGTTAHIRGVAYDSVAGAGTLSLLAGDRVVMDLDGDTYVTALITDDEIHVYVNGAEDFRFTANTFNVLSGSNIDMADGSWIGADVADIHTVYDTTNGEIEQILGDAAGADKVVTRDSAGNQVSSLNSDGLLTLDGDGGGDDNIWRMGEVVLDLDFTGTDYDTVAECNAVGLKFSDSDVPFPSFITGTTTGTWTHVAGQGWEAVPTGAAWEGPAILVPLCRADNWELEIVIDFVPTNVNQKGYVVFGYLANSNNYGTMVYIVDTSVVASQLQVYMYTNDGDDTGTARYIGVALAGTADRMYRFRCENTCVRVWDDQDNAWHDYEGRYNAGIAYTAAHTFIQMRNHDGTYWSDVYLKSLKLTYLL